MPTSQDIHYTFDMRGTTVSTLTPINVSYPPFQPNGGDTFDSDATGGFILNIGSGLDFSPSQAGGTGGQTWADITLEKHLAILGQNPGFSNIIFDDLGDATGFDMSTASGIISGGRGTFSLGDTGSASTITTNAVNTFSAPTQAVLWFETYMYIPTIGAGPSQAASYSNPRDSRFQRVLRPFENSTTFLQFDVSFNGGATYTTNVFPQAMFNISVPNQGTSFKLRITRKNVSLPKGRIGVGGWALVY